VNIYSSNSEDESSEEDERNRKRLLKAKKLDSDKVSILKPGALIPMEQENVPQYL